MIQDPGEQIDMRIAFIGGWLSWQSFGVKEVVEHLSAALAARGHDVRVFGIADKEWREGGAVNWSGAPAQAFDSIGPKSFGFAPGLQSAIEAFSPDVIHAHGLWIYGSLVSSRLGRRGFPNVISPHGMLDPWALKQSRKKKLIAGKLFEDGHLRDAAAIHALNTEELAAIRAYCPETPVAVLPNGVNLPDPITVLPPPTWRALLPIDARVLLYLGRLHRKKNLLRLIEAFAATRCNPWHLVIAGPDQDGEEAILRKSAAALGILERVHFVGSQFGADKTASFAAADGFVLPSFSEGLPMAVLEAWAAQVPVLMSEQCNLPNSFVEKAALATGVETDAIADTLRNFFEMPHGRRVAIGARGFSLVSRDYSWAGVASHFETLYEWCHHQGSPNAPSFLRFTQARVGV